MDVTGWSLSDELSGLRSASPVLRAAAAVVLLLAATALAIYKPRGLTHRGWRAQQLRAAARNQRRSRSRTARAARPPCRYWQLGLRRRYAAPR